MSRITTGIGLVSGIDTANLVDQLMAIEARPIQSLQDRVKRVDAQRAAFIEISAQLLALQNSILQFDKPDFFDRFSAQSTNESILTATPGSRAAPGSYTFRVHSLVTNHSVISRGFADRDSSPIGRGTMSIEIGNGRVNARTTLEELNGGSGVRRGTIVITDRSGETARIDLSKAQTIDDVLEAINTNTTVNVRAFTTGVSGNGTTGDRIVVEDLTPEASATGNMVIADETGGFTAANLGIAASSTTGRVDGRDLVRLSKTTSLATLNDGNGVGRFGVGAGLDDLIFIRNGNPADSFGVSLLGLLSTQTDTDLRALNSGEGVELGVIRITDRLGRTVEIDLADAQVPAVRTAQDVRQRITDAANAAGMSLSVTFVNSSFQITDTSEVSEELAVPLTIEDATGHAAADLGIAARAANGAISGREIYRVETVGDVINAINYAAGNNGSVGAAISADGNGITLEALGKDTEITVVASDGSAAADDLGILNATFSDGGGPFETRDLIAGLDTVLLRSLNGGTGVELGTISVNGRAIDLTAATEPLQTLQDVIDYINAELATDPANSLSAAINSAGTGIAIRDEADDQGQIVIEDVIGTSAAGLGIAGTFTNGLANGSNVQRQYISRQTLLAGLNLGRGVASGEFTITDSLGAVHTVQIASNVKTVGQVLDSINQSGGESIAARINDTGDGVIVMDNTAGELQLTIEDVNGGRAAEDLGIAGTARKGEAFIDGSFEIRLEIDASDTLNDLVDKLFEAGVQASVLDLGASTNPFSLSISSPDTGRRGEMTIDVRGVDLGLTTLSKAQDAVVTLGGASSSNPLFVTSPTNEVEGLIPGVTLNLISAGDEDVTVSVRQDVDAIVENVRSFVDKYNAVQAAIDKATAFDPESLERGPLLGDATVIQVRDRVRRAISQQFQGVDQQVSRLTAIGLRLITNNRLEFNEDKFRETYEESPDAVERLFGAAETGFGAVIESALENLTRDFDGVLARKDGLLADQQELINDRIDRMNIVLEAKRARLEAQFVGLESTLAALQGQQSSLDTLASLVGARA